MTARNIPHDMPCQQPEVSAGPAFILSGMVDFIQDRNDGFTLSIRGSRTTQTITWRGGQAPEWLTVGARVEVDFGRNRITLIEPGKRQ